MQRILFALVTLMLFGGFIPPNQPAISHQAQFNDRISTVPTPTPTPIPIEEASTQKSLSLTKEIGVGEIYQTVYSPDSSRLLILMSNSLILYDVQTGEELWKVDTEQYFTQATFSESDNGIFTLNRGGLIVAWDAENGEQKGEIINFKKNVNSSMISGNGKNIVLQYSDKHSEVVEVQSDTILSENNGQAFPLGTGTARISPDGSLIVLSGYDSSRKYVSQLWNAKTGKYLQGFVAGNLVLNFFNFTQANEKVAAIASKSFTSEDFAVIMLWRLDTGQSYTMIDLKGMYRSFVLSPDGKKGYVSFYRNTDIAEIDIEQAKTEREDVVRQRDPGDTSNILYSPTWLKGHTSEIESFSISPNGKYLTSVGMDGTIIIWDTEKREAIHSITIEDSEDDYYITDNALSADGEMLVRSKPDLGSLEVVEVETGKVTQDLTNDQAEPAFYYALSFSNDGKKIAAISFPKSQYFDQTITQSLSMWDATSGEILIQKEIKNKYLVRKTIFSRDDLYLVIASPQQMFMLDAENGEQKYEFGGWSEISFSPDNKFIAYDNADAGIYIADTATGKLVTSQRFGGIYDLSYSPDGKTIAICGWDVNKSARLQNNTLVFMEATDPFKRLPNKLDSFMSMVNNLEYSPDGSQVVITDFYGNLYVIDSVSLELVAKMKAVAIYPRFVSFTPDGQSIVVGNADGIVKFYSLD